MKPLFSIILLVISYIEAGLSIMAGSGRAVMFVFALALTQSTVASVWSDTVPQATIEDSPVVTFQQRRLTADPNLISQQLLDAATLQAKSAESSARAVELPMPDGSMRQYRIEASPVIAAELSASHPEIHTYKIYAIDAPEMSGRVSTTSLGFHAYINTAQGAVLIDPIHGSNAQQYRSYYKKDFAIARKGSLQPFSCGVHGRPDTATVSVESNNFSAAKTLAKTDSSLRKYRIAVATTGEYSQTVAAGDADNTLAEVVNTINRVNEIYERDLGVRLELVANNNLIIFTDDENDGYSNTNPDALLSENQSKLDAVIGSANYDIGHVFSTGGGGLASLGVVCETGAKARGETGSPDPTGDPFYIDYVAHEIGHQFNAEHSFNGTTGACARPNRSAASAYEPGSGATVMSYAGICDSENIAEFADALFHAGSIAEIVTYTRNGFGSSCSGVYGDVDNLAPVVNAGSDYTIPGSTYFELTGSATDSDVLLYRWDEMDLGIATSASTLGKDLGSNPLFRTNLPNSSPDRTFPDIMSILSNTVDLKAETLPTESRTLHFRLTAVDSNGGVNNDDMQLVVTSAAGPFAILQPDTDSLILDSTQPQVIEWNAACTELAPVSCANVDILYSTDGGNTFANLLTTANDGEEAVTLTAGNTSQGRIKIKCTDNVFFDISSVNFTVSNTMGVSLASTGAGGSYNCGTSKAVSLPGNDIEPNDSPSFANILVPPVNFSGSVNSAGDIDDFYVFTATETATYVFTLSAFTGADLNLYLLDSSFNIMQLSEGAISSSENFSAPLIAGETYYVQVSAFDTLGVPRTYTLTIATLVKKSGGGGGSLGVYVLLLILLSRCLRTNNNHIFNDFYISPEEA